jgi:nitrite reductase (NO-forming)
MVLAVLFGLFPAGAGAFQTPASAAERVTVELRLQDIRFEPSVLEIPANQDVIVRVENAGLALHSFVVPALGIDIELESGESTEVVINAPPGEYAFTCRVPGHEEAGMTGTLRVGTDLDILPSASPSPDALDATAMSDVRTCASIDAYILELQEKAGTEIAAKSAAELAAYGDAEIAQTDLPDVADAADSLADALRALNPPPEIESFHHAYIAYLQEYAHQLRSNTSGGGDPYAFMILLLMFGMPEVDLAYEQMSQEASAITEDCPAFQSAYDLLEPNLFASNTASPIALPLVDTAACTAIVSYLDALETQAGDDVRNASAALDDLFGDEVHLTAIASAFDEAAISLEAVEPPEIAREFHQAQIAKLRAYADIVRAGIARGDRTIYRMFYAMQVDPVVRDAQRIVSQHGTHIADTCPGFSDVQAFFEF